MSRISRTIGFAGPASSEAESAQIIGRMRWVTVVAPALFLLAVLAIVDVLGDSLPSFTAVLLGFAVCAVGIVVFSRSVFAVVERLQDRLRRQNRQLAAIYDAGLDATANLDPDVVLQSVADSSRALLNSRYAILAVTPDGDERRIITSGLTPDEAHSLQDLPPDGLAAHIFNSNQPFRTPDVRRHPLFKGYPNGCPAFTSLLSVPLLAHGEVIGHIIATDKLDGEYTDEDQTLMQTLALQAAIAIENAQLYEDAHAVAALKERERIAMDLHDGVIQHLYGIGLKLESGLDRIEADPAMVKADIDDAIEEMNAVIRRVRSHIFDVRADEVDDLNLRDALDELLLELRVNSLIESDLVANDDDIGDALSPAQTLGLIEVARQALENVRKHSHGHNVRVEIAQSKGVFSLSIVDDGAGISDDDQVQEGHGLTSMRNAVRNLGGELSVRPNQTAGTTVEVTIPLNPAMEA